MELGGPDRSGGSARIGPADTTDDTGRSPMEATPLTGSVRP